MSEKSEYQAHIPKGGGVPVRRFPHITDKESQSGMSEGMTLEKIANVSFESKNYLKPEFNDDFGLMPPSVRKRMVQEEADDEYVDEANNLINYVNQQIMQTNEFEEFCSSLCSRCLQGRHEKGCGICARGANVYIKQFLETNIELLAIARRLQTKILVLENNYAVSVECEGDLQVKCDTLKDELDALLKWIARMPDAGFNDADPRWKWWHERPVFKKGNE